MVLIFVMRFYSAKIQSEPNIKKASCKYITFSNKCDVFLIPRKRPTE